jgi:hypothetical protein
MEKIEASRTGVGFRRSGMPKLPKKDEPYEESIYSSGQVPAGDNGRAPRGDLRFEVLLFVLEGRFASASHAGYLTRYEFGGF